jgi:hypothetical protein
METLITWFPFLVLLGFGMVVVLLREILDELRRSNEEGKERCAKYRAG